MKGPSENGELIDRIRTRQSQLFQWEIEQDDFVPLLGCYDSEYEGTSNLDSEVNQFLADDSQSVLLLIGHSGSGKTLYTQHLIASLWSQYREGDPIPLWVSIPSCDSQSDVIEAVLKEYGLEPNQIEQLKRTARWSVVFDAYDEKRLTCNFHHNGRVDEWKTKSIFTCRHEYLYTFENFKTLFSPYDAGQQWESRLRVLYVKPFISDQVTMYVNKHIQTHETEWKTVEEYQDFFKKVPGIIKLIEIPYLLKLAVSVAPAISKQFVAEAQENQQDLTRKALLDKFFSEWFARQEKKLKDAGIIPLDEDIQPEFWQFGKDLAQLMVEMDKTQVEYDPDECNDFDEEAEKSPFAPFFDVDLPRVGILQTACLIRKIRPNLYEFEHLILRDYYVNRALFDEVKLEGKKYDRQIEKKIPVQKDKKKKTRDPKGMFKKIPVINEEDMLRGLIEQVKDRNDPEFKAWVYKKLYSTRGKKDKRDFRSSNALTVLVKAGESFNGAILSELNLTGADLSGGYFDSAKFCNSDLTFARLTRGWYRNADFSGCSLAEVEYGEYPYCEEDESVTFMDIRPDIKKLLISVGNKIIVRNLNTHEIINELSRNDSPQRAYLSQDGLSVISVYSDCIIIWDVATGKSEEIGVNPMHKMGIGSERITPGITDTYFNVKESILVTESNRPIEDLDTSHYNGFPLISGMGEYNSNKNQRFLEIWKPHDNRKLLGPWYRQTYHIIYCGAPGKPYISQDGNIAIWCGRGVHVRNLAKNELKVLNKEKRFNSVSTNYNGRIVVAVGEGDNFLTYWDLYTGESKNISGIGEKILSQCMSYDGNMVISGSKDHVLSLWDCTTGSQKVFKGHDASITKVQLSLDGRIIASVSTSNHTFLRIWDISQAQKPDNTPVEKILFYKIVQPHNLLLIIYQTEKKLIYRMYDEKMQLKSEYFLDYTEIGKLNKADMRISHDGHVIVIQTEFGFYIISLLEKNIVKNIVNYKERISCFSMSQNGRFIVVGSATGSIMICELKTLISNYSKNLFRSVSKVDISNDGKLLIGIVDDGYVVHLSSDFNSDPFYHYDHFKLGCYDLSFFGDHTFLLHFDKAYNRVLDLVPIYDNNLVSLPVDKTHKFVGIGKIKKGWMICSYCDSTFYIFDLEKREISRLEFISKIRSIEISEDISFVAVELHDLRFQLWQAMNEEKTVWQLKWSPDIDKQNQCLNLNGSDMRKSTGLSITNNRFAAQRGAIVDTQVVQLPILPEIAKRSGSPIYHNESESKVDRDRSKKCIIC